MAGEPIADQRVPLTVAEAREAALTRMDPSWAYAMRSNVEVLDTLIETVRAEERAKWDSVKDAYVEAGQTIATEFAAYRTRFEEMVLEPERERHRALVEAARAVVADADLVVHAFSTRPDDQSVFAPLRAALEALDA